MEELLELEAPEAAGSGLAVARDRRGLYIAKAPRALRVRAGDRLVGARILFEGAPPEVVARLLEGASGCRVSLCVRRRAPGTGTGTAPPPAAPSLELALPKLPKLGKSRSEAEAIPAAPPAPVPARPRLTVKEAAAGGATLEPPVKTELPGGPRFPAVEVAVPVLPVPEPQGKAGDGDGTGGLRLPSVPIPAVELVPKAEPKAPEPPLPVTPTRLGLLEAVPSLGIAVPRVEVALALPVATEGLRKLKPDAPGGTGAVKPKPPRFALPRVGLALGKLGTGAPLGTGSGLKVPKLSLAPLGAAVPVPPPGRRRSPSLPKLPPGPETGMKLRRFGGSSPDLRSGGDPKAVPGSPGALRALLLASGPRCFEAPEDAGGGLKVPALELAPPGLEAEPGRWGGLKVPRFGTSTGRMRPDGRGKSIPPPGRPNGEGKARRWVPKVGFSPPTPPQSPQHKGGGRRLRIPDVELCPPGPPQLHAGTPKLSPALCGGR